MSVPYSFWCSSCKTRHPGECPPVPAPAPEPAAGPATTHDWVETTVYDLNQRWVCGTCKTIHLVSIVAAYNGAVPPAGPCPGKKAP